MFSGNGSWFINTPTADKRDQTWQQDGCPVATSWCVFVHGHSGVPAAIPVSFSLRGHRSLQKMYSTRIIM